MTSTPVPIEQVWHALARIAARPGWRVTRSLREPGGIAGTIEKDGVLLDFVRHTADSDVTVRLCVPVHPPVALYPYRDPPIGELLDAIGVPREPAGLLTAIADRLPAVKRHLSDPAVFRRHVLAEAERLHASYVRLASNPEFGGLRASMLARHPWLDHGVPKVDALLLAPQGGARAGRGARIAVVLLAVGIGMAIVRML